MSDQSITVVPGITTTLNVRLPSGATIQNLDSKNAIWVSSNPGLTPGVGSRIGPKGSLQWTTDTAPCYAITDTGVTTAVSTTVSTDVSNPVNPVDIGVAVATQLLQTGVPSVLLGDMLYQGIVAGGLTTLNIPNINKYASVTVYVMSPTKPVMWTFVQTQSNIEVHRFQMPQGVAWGTSIGIDMPVRGDTLGIWWTDSAAAPQIVVVGTNRQLPLSIQSANEVKTYSWNQAFTFPNKYYAPLVFVNNGRPWYAVMLVTGGNAGFFGATTISSGGVVSDMQLVDSKGGFAGSNGAETERVIQLPIGVTQIYFQAITSATYTAQFTLFPSI